MEVLDYADVKMVSRNEAKSNLHAIRENNARRKIENVLFDRFWYQNREEKQRRERMKKQRVVEENLRKAKEDELKRQKLEAIGQLGELIEENIVRSLLPPIIRFIDQSSISRKDLYNLLEVQTFEHD